MRAALAAFGVCSFSQAVLAADVQALVRVVRAAPAYDWTGFCVGVNAGYGAASDPSTIVDFVPAFGTMNGSATAPTGSSGWLGGGQVGLNWQKDHWLLGIEADIQATNQSGANCYATCRLGLAGTSLIEQKLPWFATLRGRFGIANGPLLLYATGGLALGAVETNMTTAVGAVPGASAAAHGTRTGWTVGGGVEAGLSDGWTAKVEYLNLDLGGVSGSTPPFLSAGGVPIVGQFTADFRDHLVRVGLNYRFAAPSTGAAASASGPLYTWQGFYLGVNGGHAIAKNPSSHRTPVYNETFAAASSGWLGGGQLGYNWQTGKLVYGVETDLQFGNQRSEPICVFSCNGAAHLTLDQKLPWFGTARGRLGYAAGPVLFYATGGMAYGRVEMTTNVLAVGITSSEQHDTTKLGWTLGGGIEGAVSDRWTVKAEYLYLDFGSTSFDVDDGVGIFGRRTVTSDLQNHVFRLGVNYRIN